MKKLNLRLWLGMALFLGMLNFGFSQNVAMGTFIADYSAHAKGSYKCVAVADSFHLVFGEDFWAKGGPDLHLMLSTKTTDEILANENELGDTVILHMLTPWEEKIGPFTIPITSGIELEKYKTLLNYCIGAGGFVYGAAPFEAMDVTSINPEKLSGKRKNQGLHFNRETGTLTIGSQFRVASKKRLLINGSVLSPR